MGAPQKEPLLAGREACVEALTSAVALASAGRFAVVEVRGEAGVGKSTVLVEAGRLARVAGLPLALLLDDLQWADRLSLELVEYLIRHPPDGRVLLVVAFRDAHPPAGVVDAVTRAGDSAWRIRLGPLRERDLPPCSDRRRRLLLRASRGNPRYLRMLADLPDATLADLVREGGDADLPADLEHLLAAEFTMLSATAQRVAQAIAISGEHAALDLVASVARLPVSLVVEAMDELCGAGLGTMDGAWFAFQHPLLCVTARATAGPAWRTQAHARAAEYLAAHDAPPGLLAGHLEQSAQHGDDNATLLQVGAALMRRAPTTAVRLLGKAFRIRPPTARRPGLILRYARSLLLAGELDRGWEVLQELLADDHPLRAAAATVGAEIARLKGDLDTATALLTEDRTPPLAQEPSVSSVPDETAAPPLTPEPSTPEAAAAPSLPPELSVPRGTMESGAGGNTQAVQLAALAALREDVAATSAHACRYDGRRPALVAGALTLRAWAALSTGHVSAARTLAADAAHLIAGLGTVTLVPHVELIGLLAEVETRLGSTTTAAAHLARAYEVIDQTGLRSALPYILVVDAALQTRLGRLPSALDLTDQAVSAAERMGSPELAALAHAVAVRPLLGIRGPAAALVRTGRPRSPAWRRIAQLNLALAHAAAEDTGPVLALLADPNQEWPADPLTRVLRLGALAQALSGEAASHAADAAEVVALASGLDYEIGLALYAKAYVASRAGNARDLATRSATRFAACGAALDEARAHHLAGLCDPDRARAGLGLAKAGYAACGADWLLSAVSRDQRRVAASNARRRGSPLDGAVLTVRERQIADLVADGLTNQQIADQLFLSRRTVESHLSRIFPKLAVRSRVAMARRLGERVPK